MNYLHFNLRTFCIIILLSINNAGFAQLINGNAFLQGYYVQGGISPCGTFGSTEDAPAGYYPRGSTTNPNRLGFNADREKDGWNVGSPDYCGDYFLPGTPEEGWGVQIDSVNYNNNQFCFPNDISGSIISYSNSGSQASATWEGNVSGLNIRAITYFSINALYITTEVTVSNTTGSTINNVYYMRNVDPDNDKALGGEYQTTNTIEQQNPNSQNTALVSAIGGSFGCYLGLGSKDCRARVSYGGFDNRNASDIWNGTGGLFSTGSLTDDKAISIAFFLGNIPAGESATFAYSYIFDSAELNNALASTSAVITNQPLSQSKCLGDVATFSVTATGSGLTYQWRKDGVNISGATNSSFTINSISDSDTGNYDVTVSGICAPLATSEIANLKIGAPIPSAFTTSTSEVCQGQTGVSYMIPNDSSMTYSWAYTGTGVTIIGNTNQITIDFSTTATDGDLIVTATNTCGVSLPQILTIDVSSNPPQPSPFTTSTSYVCSGQTGVVYIVPNDPNFTYSWSYSGTDATLTGTGNGITIDFSPTATSGDLNVVSTNACGTSPARSFTITVGPGPVITSQPSNSSILVGGNTSFNVTVSDSGNTYQWQLNSGFGFNNLYNSATYSNVTAPTLNITNATLSMDGYLFRCLIYSSCPVVTSDSATLSVSFPACSDAPPVDSTISTANPACNGAYFTLSLSGSTSGYSGITYQWQSSPDNVSYTNISGATGSTYTTVQTSSTYYRCEVTCNISGLSTTSTPLYLIMGSLINCYCIPKTNGSSPCITNVTIDLLNNTTSGCGVGNYKQTATTTLFIGMTYPLSVTTDGNAIISVWIDFNQNGVYDTWEWQQVSISSTPGDSSTIDIFIPDSALSGNTGMRVYSRASGYSNGAGDACRTGGSGEAEDYLISLIYPSPCTGTPASGTIITADNTVCAGESYTLNLSGVTTGFSGLKYQWQSSSDDIVYSNISGAVYTNFSDTATISTYYRFIINCDSSGMSDTSTPFYITVNSLPTLTIIPSGSTSFCNGDSVTLDAGTFSSYDWNTGATTQVITATSTGSYSVTVTDGNGCNESDTQSVNVDSPAISIAGDTIGCPGGSTTLSAISLQTLTYNISLSDLLYLDNNCDTTGSRYSYGGTVGFNWIDNGFGTVSNIDVKFAVGVECSSGGSTYSTSLNGNPGPSFPQTPNNCECDFSGIVTLVLPTSGYVLGGSNYLTISGFTNPFGLIPDISLNNYYANVTVTYGGSAVSSYLWSPVAGSTQSITVNPNTSTTYTVTITDSLGCIASASKTIIMMPVPVISSGGPTTFCQGDSVALSSNIGTSFYWMPTGDTTQSINAKTSGNYRVVATNANGTCSDTSAAITVSINLPPSPVITPGGPTTFCNGSVTLDAGNFSFYLWNTGSNSRIITATASGNYIVTVTDVNGCSAASPSLPVTDTCNVNINMTNGSSTTCNANFYDSGGSAGAYLDDENFTYTFYPNSGKLIQLAWSSFTSESCCDMITIYDGPNTSSPVLYGPSGGTLSIPTFTSSAPTGTITVKFTSDVSVTDAGWSANVTCVPNVTCSTLTVNSTAGEILCNGGTTTIAVSASGGTSPYSGTGNFTVSAGTYTYTVTDSKGCSANTSITVSESSALTASATSGAISCNGGTAIVTVTASGGTPQYSGTGNFMVSPGTYSYLVTDANGCIDSTSVTVSEPALLTADATSGGMLCNGDSATVSVTATGGTLPYTGIGNFTKSTGAYIFNVTDANGCNATASITIAEPSSITAFSNAGTILCNSDSTAITVSASGGTSPYTGTGNFTEPAGTYNYTVTDVNGCTAGTSITLTEPATISATATAGTISCNGGTTIVIVSGSGGTLPYNGTGFYTKSAGTYNYTVTDVNGCSANTSITIAESTPLIITASAGTISCNGGNTMLVVTASGGTSPYSGTGIFTKTADTYMVTVSDANTCTSTTSVTISEPTAITLVVGSSSTTCGFSNGITTVLAAGGTSVYTYLWTPSGQTTAMTSNLAQGIYTIKVTDSNGCTSTSSVGVSDISGPTVSVLSSTDATCKGTCNGTAGVSVTGAGGPFTITWSNGETGANAVALCAGNNVVSAVDTNSCFVNYNIAITEPSAIQLTLTKTNATCKGANNGTATANTTGGTGAFSYIWSNAQTGQTASGLAAGCYTVTATDANNCTSSSSVCITEPTLLSVSATFINTSCNGACNGQATATAANGTAPYLYSWSNAQSGQIATGLCAGTHTVTATDANGCTVSTNVTIIEPSAVTATASAGSILCNGGSTTVTVSASGGTSPYTGTGAFTKLTGTYPFTVTDAKGCTSSTSVIISEPATLTAGSTAETILCNGGTTSVTVTAGGGTSPYTGTGNLTEPAGAHNYIITDVNGCTASTSVIIAEPTVLTAGSLGGTLSCNGGTTSVTVTASGGTAPYTGTGTFTESAGTYNFTVMDANGCTANTSVTISEPSALTVSSSAGTILCNGELTNASVTASGGTSPYTYAWSTGATTTALSNITAGTYTVTVTDSKGCSNTASVAIFQPNTLTISSTAGTISCFGGSTTVDITANGGTSPYTGTGIFTESAGTYNFTVTDAKGCSTNISVTISQPTFLVASSTASTISCNGGNATVTVTASGGTTPYTGDGSFTETAGTYNYTVTDAKGCSTSTSITITQPIPLTASSTAGTILCKGGTTSVTVTASGGTAPYTGTGSFTEPAGTYNYTVTDSKGCTANTSVNLTEPGTTLLTAGSTAGAILCSGGTTTVTVTAGGGTPPYTGTGSFTETADSINYTVTDSKGCTAITTVVISEPPILTAGSSAGVAILCNGGTTTVTVTANGGTAPYSGTGAITDVAGVHNYSVTDANGCTANTSLTISQPTLLTVSTSSGTILCNGSTTSVNVTATGGTSPYSGTGNFTKSAGTYNFTVTDANSCTAVESLTLNEPATVIASATAGTILCNGGTTTATVTATGGTSPYTGTGNFTKPAGTFNFMVTDANSCNGNSSLTIAEPEPLIAAIDTIIDASTSTSNDGMISMGVTGGTSPYSYSWSHLPTLNNKIANNLITGYYAVTVTDINNCKTSLVSIFVDFSTSGNNKIKSNFKVDIFPNPSSGEFNVNIFNPGEYSVSLRIFNVLGAEVFYSNEINATEVFKYKIKGNILSRGIYNLQIQVNSNTYYRKIVIK